MTSRKRAADGAGAAGEDMARPLPFSRPWPVERLAPEAPVAISVETTEEERRAAARFLGVDTVSAMTLAGTAERWGEDGVIVRGEARAVVVQTCVVTLEPVASEIAAALERRFLPGVAPVEASELELGPGAENEPEPLGETIDLAQLLLEAVALEIDPYPRKEGAALGSRVYAPPGVEALTDEAMRPFSGLAALKARLERGNGGDAEG